MGKRSSTPVDVRDGLVERIVSIPRSGWIIVRTLAPRNLPAYPKCFNPSFGMDRTQTISEFDGLDLQIKFQSLVRDGSYSDHAVELHGEIGQNVSIPRSGWIVLRRNQRV